jgi:hypothetical protein
MFVASAISSSNDTQRLDHESTLVDPYSEGSRIQSPTSRPMVAPNVDEDEPSSLSANVSTSTSMAAVSASGPLLAAVTNEEGSSARAAEILSVPAVTRSTTSDLGLDPHQIMDEHSRHGGIAVEHAESRLSSVSDLERHRAAVDAKCIGTPTTATTTTTASTTRTDQVDLSLALHDPMPDKSNSVDGGQPIASPTQPPLQPPLPHSASPKSVTVERKQELLLDARHDRRRWLEQVPLPYAIKGTITGTSNYQCRLSSTFIGRQIPTINDVLSCLYDSYPVDHAIESQATNGLLPITEEVASISSLSSIAFPTGSDVISMEIKHLEQELAHESFDSSWTKVCLYDINVLHAYQTFWHHLNDPAAATIVTNIRRFCTRFNRNTFDPDQDVPSNEKLVSSVASQLHSYITSTLSTILGHPLWKTNSSQTIANQSETTNTNNIQIRRSLESLVYGHCNTRLERLLMSDTYHDDERAWDDRLNALSFVTPVHLDIACLSDPQYTENEQILSLFKIPIQILQSIDRYNSPYEKLQRLLLLYHSINAALTAVLNPAFASDGSSNSAATSNRLPSADDVLPTIIWCVIQAKPVRILYNLRLIEEFCVPEYLRGEAGYAFTNVYGAVQFLRGIKLDASELDGTESGSTSSVDSLSLTISPDELRNGLAASRALAEAKRRLNEETRHPLAAFELNGEHTSASNWHPIPLEVIRERRRKGEALSVEWALQWQKENHGLGFISGDEDDDFLLSRTASTTAPVPGRPVVRRAAIEEAMDGLPAGFARSYAFLTASPEDIRLSDLPQLLGEYRLLVHTTETLIGQRAARIAASRRERLDRSGEEIYASVRNVDPMLLPIRHPDSPRAHSRSPRSERKKKSIDDT